MIDLGGLAAGDRTDLEAALAKLGLDHAVPLTVNTWKRTVTLAATDGAGRRVVLKWRSPDADGRIVGWFERERAALRQAVPGGLGPGLLADGETWLMLPHIAGRSALDALEAALEPSTSEADASSAATATRAWLDALVPAYRATLERAARDDAGDGPSLRSVTATIHRSFARSGPMRSVRRTTSAAIGRILAAATGRPIQRIVARHPALAARGWAHGDLHLDNIWLAEDGRLMLLDLATVEPAGFPAMDLVYATAATLARAAGHRSAGNAVEAELEAGLGTLGPIGGDIVTAARAFAAVGRTNPRFAPDLGATDRLWARTWAPLRLGVAAVRR